jgi:hypothetical protein
MTRIRLVSELSLALCLAVLVLNASPVKAANQAFMADSPVTRFTSAQKKQHQEMLIDLVKNAAEGEKRNWQTDDGRTGGEGTVTRTYERNGLPCKDLSVRTWFRTMKATNDYRACQTKEGQWMPSN